MLLDDVRHHQRQQLKIAWSVDPLICTAWDEWTWADDEARVRAVEVCADDCRCDFAW